MIDKKIDVLINDLKAHSQRIVKSKKASKEFLIKTDIISKNGKLTKHYKHLCIPREQA